MKKSREDESGFHLRLRGNHPLTLVVTLSHFHMWKDYLIGLQGFNVEDFHVLRRLQSVDPQI